MQVDTNPQSWRFKNHSKQYYANPYDLHKYDLSVLLKWIPYHFSSVFHNTLSIQGCDLWKSRGGGGWGACENFFSLQDKVSSLTYV